VDIVTRLEFCIKACTGSTFVHKSVANPQVDFPKHQINQNKNYDLRPC
jgi:hypothetical protein